jgi:hypothetical protein
MLSSDEDDFRRNFYEADTAEQEKKLWLELARRHEVPIKLKNYPWGSKIP